jgi:uncharacterized protein (DUF58 family)
MAGAAIVTVAMIFRVPAVAGFGGAMLLAVAIGRASSLAAVTRLRAAGFEMVWNAQRRVARTSRGEAITLQAELRNRGVDEMRGVGVRAVISSMLEATVEPTKVDLPPHSRVSVTVTIRPKRVGRWGVHGMALEVRGATAGGEALYEVPLMFANPYGIEVLPKAIHQYLESPRGGRARRGAEAGKPAPIAGEGDQLREIREHVSGDAFKRIAWKASARRGKLMVREMEREEREVIWLMLDASVELWAGAEGKAPLDAAVEECATLAVRHLARGDRVGLVVFASRARTWIAPKGGASHAKKIAAALASAANMVDADRSDLDEWEVGQRVAEHARPLDPRGLGDIPRSNLDMLAARGESLRTRAPFAPRLPFAKSSREQTLRHYLASFGVEVPPRSEGEQELSHATLAQALEKISREKTRPSAVVIFSPAPAANGDAARALRRLRGRRIEVRWVISAPPHVVEREPHVYPLSVEEAVDEAVHIRGVVAKSRAERALRKLGVRGRPAERRRMPSE